MVTPDRRERFDTAVRAIATARTSRTVSPRPVGPLRQGDICTENMQVLKEQCTPINWSQTAVWVFFNGNFQSTGTCNIVDLPAQTLYEIVEYCVGNLRMLFYLYAGDEWRHDTQAPALAAKRWLGLQPLFRAVVQEALKKNVAFSDAAYVYLRHFVVTAVVNRPQSLTLTPWADENRRAQQSDLQEFLQHPAQVVTEEDTIERFGRKGRAIQLDD
jgi:hypothetical protein